MTGIYIHVPFCGSRCIYCDFYSTTLLERREEYVTALCHEIVARRSAVSTTPPRPLKRGLGGEAVPTIYLGGGTPSMLGNTLLRRILDCVFANYDVLPDAEVTLEANPDDVGEALLHDLPINRLSMGVQSMHDERLRFLHRRHTALQAVEAIETARRCGITNISIDLIYGLPGQTMEEWRDDVAQALALPVTHLSAYALSYEPHTLLYNMRERGEVQEADDELSREMYYHLKAEAEAKGFGHYEISNFALPGCESRHNSSYWTGVPYMGFGPGAHSYDGGSVRRSNPANLDTWMKGECEEEHLSRSDLFNERVFLSLRTRSGLDIEALRRNFADEYAQVSSSLRRMQQDGRLLWQPPCLCLPSQYLFTSDDIISDLFV